MFLSKLRRKKKRNCCGHPGRPIFSGWLIITHYVKKVKPIKLSDIPSQIQQDHFPQTENQHTSRLKNQAHTALNSSGAFI